MKIKLGPKSFTDLFPLTSRVENDLFELLLHPESLSVLLKLEDLECMELFNFVLKRTNPSRNYLDKKGVMICLICLMERIGRKWETNVFGKLFLAVPNEFLKAAMKYKPLTLLSFLFDIFIEDPKNSFSNEILNQHPRFFAGKIIQKISFTENLNQIAMNCISHPTVFRLLSIQFGWRQFLMMNESQNLQNIKIMRNNAVIEFGSNFETSFWLIVSPYILIGMAKEDPMLSDIGNMPPSFLEVIPNAILYLIHKDMLIQELVPILATFCNFSSIRYVSSINNESILIQTLVYILNVFPEYLEEILDEYLNNKEFRERINPGLQHLDGFCRPFFRYLKSHPNYSLVNALPPSLIPQCDTYIFSYMSLILRFFQNDNFCIFDFIGIGKLSFIYIATLCVKDERNWRCFCQAFISSKIKDDDFLAFMRLILNYGEYDLYFDSLLVFSQFVTQENEIKGLLYEDIKKNYEENIYKNGPQLKLVLCFMKFHPFSEFLSEFSDQMSSFASTYYDQIIKHMIRFEEDTDHRCLCFIIKRMIQILLK